MSANKNFLAEMLNLGVGGAKDQHGLERLVELGDIDVAFATPGAALPASKVQSGSPLTIVQAAPKEALVQIGAELAAICGDAVHEDGRVIDRMWSWLQGELPQFAAIDDQVSELDAIGARFDELEAELRARRPTPLRLKEIHAELAMLTKAREERVALAQSFMHTVGLGRFLASKDGQLTALCLARWAANGYPQIVMGHKYAAALLTTNISEDVLELVRAPWNGFVIEVPDGLLSLWHPDLKRRSPVTRILVCQHANAHGGERAWIYVAMTDTVMTAWRFGVSTAELLPPVLEENMFAGDPTLLEVDDADRRVQSLIGRLIVNTCLAMSDPDLVKEIGPGHKRYAAAQRARSQLEPVVRTFQVGRPVKVDYRKEIAAYVEGGTKARRAITTQWLTAGHYKRQHHGPKGALVKVIWREPYWSGRADAPIAVRPHVLGARERANEP